MVIGETGIGACVTMQSMETCKAEDYEAIEIIANTRGIQDLLAALDVIGVMLEGGTIQLPLGRRMGRPCVLIIQHNPRVEPGEDVL